jgi:hypothetical protein
MCALLASGILPEEEIVDRADEVEHGETTLHWRKRVKYGLFFGAKKILELTGDL